MQKQSGKDPAALDMQVKRILHELELQKEAFQKAGRNFTVIDEDLLRRKLARVRSPMIIGQSWTNTTPGGVVTYSANIHNPDPGRWVLLFGYVFVGPANMVPSIGEALATADLRFARLTQPKVPGLSIAANESATLTYSIPIPTDIQPSNYQGNMFLYQAEWHDMGEYLDRGSFVFAVT